MREPDWSRLPFPIDPSQWRAWAEVPDGRIALALLAGDDPEQPLVWLHRDAVAAFARGAGIAPARAVAELGAGVLRWVRAAAPLQYGQCMAECRFRGAPQVQLSVGRLGNDWLVHLPHRP